MAWKTARKWGLVNHNACEGIELPRLNPVERPSFTSQEMSAIIEAAEEPFKTFYRLAAETGMRAGELCGLRWEDVDLDSSTVYVRQSSWRGRMGTPKSAAGIRRFSISQDLATHLANFSRGWEVGMPLVFHTRTGQAWDSRFVVRDQLQPLLKSLGIGRAGLHAFRHGNATTLLGQGIDVKTVAARLGHADPSITLKVYAHAIPQRDVEAAQKMAVILTPKDANSRDIKVQRVITEGVVASA